MAQHTTVIDDDDQVLDWSEFPLFAPPGSQIPVVSGNQNENASPALTALSHLLHDEETPEEASDLLRDQGNRHFKRRGKRALHLAITKYSEAVSAASGDSVATAAALCNRAAAELKLSNFGRALTDAAKAARLDPTNVKAHFRAAVAATQLEQFDTALRHTTLAITLCKKQPASADLAALQRQRSVIDRAKSASESRAKHQTELAERTGNADAMIVDRGLRIGRALYAQQHEYRHTRVRRVDGKWSWPILLVYPTTDYGEQSDYIECVAEDASVADLMGLVFGQGDPPWWDVRRLYRHVDLLHARVRVDTRDDGNDRDDGSEGWRLDDGGKWLVLASDVSIAQLVARDDYVVPLYPVLQIVPKSAAD